MIKAIIFDADNTLYKIVARRAYSKMFGILAEETNIDRQTLEENWKKNLKKILDSKDAQNPEKRSRKYCINEVLKNLKVPEKQRHSVTKDALEVFWKQVVEDLEFEKDIVKTILRLKKDFRLAVASDEYKEHLEMKLNRVFVDWRDYFEFIVSSSDVGKLKPSEKYFELALKKLGISKEEAVVVGDSVERDIMPAKALGIKAILVSKTPDIRADLTVNSVCDISLKDINVLD